MFCTHTEEWKKVECEEGMEDAKIDDYVKGLDVYKEELTEEELTAD